MADNLILHKMSSLDNDLSYTAHRSRFRWVHLWSFKCQLHQKVLRNSLLLVQNTLWLGSCIKGIAPLASTTQTWLNCLKRIKTKISFLLPWGRITSDPILRCDILADSIQGRHFTYTGITVMKIRRLIFIVDAFILVRRRVGSLYLYWLTLIQTCTSNHIHYNVWVEITYPFSNFNGVTVEV